MGYGCHQMIWMNRLLSDKCREWMDSDSYGHWRKGKPLGGMGIVSY